MREFNRMTGSADSPESPLLVLFPQQLKLRIMDWSQILMDITEDRVTESSGHSICSSTNKSL
jgi:hypothetical protein